MQTRAVHLAYGETGLSVQVPEDATVVEPVWVDAVADPRAEVQRALREPVAGPPLRERVRPGQTVAISVCDITRPQPRRLMVTAVLDELEGVVAAEDVTVLVATGTHRGSSRDEHVRMFGEDLLARVRVVDHDCRDAASLVWCGTHGDGVPVWLNRRWVEADVKITTGFVEPHFFAGFSGGPKMVAPGLAGLETVLTLHDAARIGSPQATWAVCEGNPVHDDVRAVAAATGTTYALDVLLNREQQVVQAFGGDLLAMHEVARARAKEVAMVAVPALFDVVVTTNAGYPLDQNLYQAVKGMTAAAAVVRPGGTIVCAAECRDGFPDHGGFREVLAEADSPQALLDLIAARERTVPDQWQVQVLARVLVRAQVQVYSGHLAEDDLRSAHLGKASSVEDAVSAALAAAGPGATLCVLPEGPMTIAYVEAGGQ